MQQIEQDQTFASIKQCKFFMYLYSFRKEEIH